MPVRRVSALFATIAIYGAGAVGLAPPAAAAASTWRSCGGSQIVKAAQPGLVTDHHAVRGPLKACATAYTVARAYATALARFGVSPQTVAHRRRVVRCVTRARPFGVRRVTCAGRYRFDVSVRFPRTPVRGGFLQATGPLPATWQSPALQDTGTVAIVSPGVTQGELTTPGAPAVDGGTGASSATWNIPFRADQEAYLTVPAVSATPGDWVQVAARVTSRTNLHFSCYFLRVTPSTGIWDLRQKLNGENSTSIKSFAAPLQPGDSLGLQVKGTRLMAFRKTPTGPWAGVGSATSAAVRGAGYISFTLQGLTARGGAFGGGTIPPT